MLNIVDALLVDVSIMGDFVSVPLAPFLLAAAVAVGERERSEDDIAEGREARSTIDSTEDGDEQEQIMICSMIDRVVDEGSC